MKEEYERDLNHVWMILELEQLYEEDYQMRMLQSNMIPGLLQVCGQGENEKSIYRYEISGKYSVKVLGEKEKIGYQWIESFMKQLVKVLYDVNNYFLDVNCLSLDQANIYRQNEQFYFCYCPAFRGNIWEEFHALTEYFVREADYDDKEGIYLAYELHKASMEGNYNIEQSLEMILEKKEMEIEKMRPERKEESYELEEDMILDDWAGERETRGHVLRDREGVWGYLSRRIRKKNKELWEDIEENS